MAPRLALMSGYFSDRWYRRVPIARLVWWDMLTIGTLLNGALTLTGLIALANKLPEAMAVACLILLIPYNLFIAASVIRTAARPHTRYTLPVQLLALGWLTTFTLI
ncbi:hypothetical protein [Methyloversatilis sp.]|uniref:hypothetical protein n=1 Tax=Methyloversatilis sp. TaxID=2569862 RepID=UPI003F725AD1